METKYQVLKFDAVYSIRRAAFSSAKSEDKCHAKESGGVERVGGAFERSDRIGSFA